MTSLTRRLAEAPWALRTAGLVAGLAAALALPWLVYPPVAMDIACWALFAVALDLLLGYTGLLAINLGWPFPLAVLGGAVLAMLLALPIGFLSVRRSGIYFAMVTLAFAQTIYFVANQWRSLTGGENGLQSIPRELGGLDLSEPFWFYYAGLPIVLAGLAVAWRIVRSPFGQVLVAIRDNPARARALGYPIDRYKILAFVLSAGLAGLAGGLFAISHGFASLQEVYWTTSGKVVMMTVLGGIGTLWGSVLGATLVVQLEDYLASAGFDGIGIITGAIFCLIVLLFRRGIWGTVAHRLGSSRRPAPAPEPGVAPPAQPDIERTRAG